MGQILMNYEKGKPTSVSKYYISERTKFKEALNLIKHEYRLAYIEKELESYKNQLAETSPEVHKLLLEGELYNKKENYFYVDREPFALANFVVYLQYKLELYKEVERLNFCDIKWLKDFNSFVRFYEALTKYNFVEVSFADFKQFWSLNSTLVFNTNIFETSVLLYELVANELISEITVESMLEKSLIIGRHGNNKSKSILTKTNFTKNKSKYSDEAGDQFPTENFYNAMLKYGIKLKHKPNPKKK